jgi:oligopeptide transport system ATP-binding protein
MENRVILSIKDLVVKFRVRSRVLTAIRNISFDIYDGETIAIVGESGSGKSVLTKTFTNMLESNGYIAKGSINYYPSDASKNDLKTKIRKNVDLVSYHRNALERQTIKQIVKANKKQIKELETKLANLASFSIEAAQAKIVDLNQEIESLKQQLKSEFTKTNKINRQISKHNQEISDLNQEINQANDPTSVQRMTNNINDLKEENAHFK